MTKMSAPGRDRGNAIESAKKPETRSRRIEAAVANVRDPESRKAQCLAPSADLRK